MGNTKDSIMLEFISEFSNSIKIETLMHEALKLYKFIPHSLMPINYDYHEEVFEELKKNEYFRDRWWLFENYFADNIRYNVPVITFEDVTKIFEKVVFVDIRSLQEYENIRIKDSCFLSLEKNKYFDATMNLIENSKGSKLFVLVNNKGSDYKEKVMFLLNKKVKFVCILIGGIDVVFIDEPNLINIRK